MGVSKRRVTGRLVQPGAELERLASGFVCTEGPVWHPVRDCLLFSDIPASTRYRWSMTDGLEVDRQPTNKGNGMTLDAQCELIICEHLTNAVVREHADGTRTVLASAYRGSELNSPNDVVVKSDGAIYFTDPNYGRQDDVFGRLRACELDFQGVFRLSPDGADLRMLVDDFEQPNGLCFSPDEQTLYVNDTPVGTIRAFQVEPDGSLGAERMLCEGIGTGDLAAGAVDGMKCDEEGNVYVTGPGGIWVITPDSEPLGVIEVPERALNLNWGGRDWADLCIAGEGSIYRLSMRVAGSLASYMAA